MKYSIDNNLPVIKVTNENGKISNVHFFCKLEKYKQNSIEILKSGTNKIKTVYGDFSDKVFDFFKSTTFNNKYIIYFVDKINTLNNQLQNKIKPKDKNHKTATVLQNTRVFSENSQKDIQTK